MAHDIAEGLEIIFLLGAGASKEANAPDVWELVDGFRTQANDPLLNDVITRLEEHRGGAPGGRVIDIEMLLEEIAGGSGGDSVLRIVSTKPSFPNFDDFLPAVVSTR